MWMHKPHASVGCVDDTAQDGGIWCALESQSWDTGSRASPLDGLQLPDWSDSGIISSNESLIGIGGLADPELQVPHWGCQSPSPCASSAHQPTRQPSLVTFTSADITNEVGMHLQSPNLSLGNRHVWVCGQVARASSKGSLPMAIVYFLDTAPTLQARAAPLCMRNLI